MELPYDVLVHLFSFLDGVTILHASVTHKAWRGIASDDHFWKHKASLRDYNNTTRLCTTQLNTEPTKWSFLYRDLGDVFVPARMVNLAAQGIEASSTDFNQILPATLIDDYYFWSSKGNGSEDSNEFVTYRLSNPRCIVKHLDIHVFHQNTNLGILIYAPQFLQISVGFSANFNQMHYTSQKFPVSKINTRQRFVLDQPQFGSFVRIELLGRQQIHANKYHYTALRYVEIGGVSSEALRYKKYLSDSLLHHATKCTQSINPDHPSTYLTVCPSTKIANTLQWKPLRDATRCILL